MYITHTDIQTLLGITMSPGEQSTAGAVIAGIEAIAESYCGRKWNTSGSVETVTEYHDGGSDVFFLSQGPALASPSPTVTDGASQVDAAGVYNYGTYIKVDGSTTPGNRNIRVEYSVAAAQIPADLKYALIQWAAQQFKSSKDGGKEASRVSVGPLSIDYSDATKLTESGIPRSIQNVLDRHRILPGF